MATMTESTIGTYPESPLDTDDVVPCKGCGEILEEGKAFELAGNRWHIDCFRCNTCNTLLDSDANLLLLGDGSLICNNCTYSCSSCGNKIEDLAILTGDQAFCANCFKCRNCKRKIENLRYARTSQGIFCMDCHEALMARRRKKTGRNAAQRSKLSTSVLDKSLPAIPPPNTRATQYIPENEVAYTNNYSSPTVEGPSVSKTIIGLRDPDSRPSTSEQSQSRDALTLPSTTFKDKRQSYMSQKSDMSGGEEFLIPLAFDPTPPVQSPTMPAHGTPRTIEEKPRDYFTRSATSPSLAGAQSNKASPHIAYQEKGRQPSRDVVNRREGSRSGSAAASPYIPSERSRLQQEESNSISQIARSDIPPDDRFKLQDAPRAKRQPSHSTQSPHVDTLLQDDYVQPQQTSLPPDLDDENAYTTPRLSQEPSPVSTNESPRPPQHPAILANIPKRGDSLEGAKRTQTIPRKELNAGATIPQSLSDVLTTSASSAKAPTDLERANGGKVISAPFESPQSKSIFDTPNSPPRQTDPFKSINDSFIDPRAPPIPPARGHSRTESGSTMQSRLHSIGEPRKSPSLPRYSAGGDFTMDEDMARILGPDGQNQESFLRRVSNSVRHGRSYSDKAGRFSRDKYPRSPGMGAALGYEISSPTTASPENKEEIAWFKNELRREREKLIEREKRIAELEAQLDSTADIKQVNSELKEKRSTMVVLDTQKEIVVRELEVLTEHIASAKANKEPFDMSKMTNTVLREFAEALEKLKNSFAPQIEASIQKRNDLMEEIANLTQMKDKSFMEFEQLSSKNAQLAELNNQLVHQIQELYKANSGAAPDASRPSVNGLGIYGHSKDKVSLSTEGRETRNMSTDLSAMDSGTTLAAGEAEPVTVLQGPHMVNIRKGGQPKKFDWRKGQKVAKGVTKGLKGAFSSAQQNYSREMHFAETGAYGQQSAGPEPSLSKNNQESKQGGFGLFSGAPQRPAPRPNGLYSSQGNASTPSLLTDATSQLYGADLEQRAEYENTDIPIIVRRCVDEVEARGMDVEGIYRKSGGNSQVQQVRDGFERDVNNNDISDPDLDIHAVTSGLKQYFRKLPVPLITYEVYDKLLDTTTIVEKEARIDAMRDAVRALPEVHYTTLEYLMKHLARVVLQEEENLMTSMNIAVVFAPTIMRPESIARELSDTKPKNECCMWMVENVNKVFQS